MALFQVSVLKKYLKLQDDKIIDKAYKKFTSYFQNAEIQENIRKSKEEQFQATFLTELFVKILGYTLNPNPKYNLTTEFKNESNNRKADGAILKEENAVGVIELKGTNTKHLEGIRQQAFDYKANQKNCVYVITSNFEKLRFYINDATEFLEFDLFELNREDLRLLWLCLSKENIYSDLPLRIKEASLVVEEAITKEFYKDYSVFKRELYRDLVKKNAKDLKAIRQSELTSETLEDEEFQQEINKLEKNVKLNLFKKSQKLIDRFLFVFFAEDRGLLPPNSIHKIIRDWEMLQKMDVEQSLYERYKIYFNYLNTGRKPEDDTPEIFAYNGGLFKPDHILDMLKIDSDLLLKHTKKLAVYDFESQVDVNILGHIFENSLNEIESINAEIEGADFDKQKSKRKKDGVFYTPKYITKYMVENTVGKLCEEKKNELGFREEEYFKGRKRRQKSTLEGLLKILDDYRDWLLKLTICDPACGSGAFLNQALDFLIKEHRYIDEMHGKLLGESFRFPGIENTILENNIYGVDINEESVEIARLSLWLRTAKPHRKLNDLSSNIKCGNSLIDDRKVAGEKAFKWENEFPEIFKNGGFDVVIGNPPYITYALGAKQKHNSNIIEYLKSNYPLSSVYKVSSYLIFIDKGLQQIKGSGILSYIVPNTYHTNSYYKDFRAQLINKYQIDELLDVRYKVFEDAEMGYTSIPFISKKLNSQSTRIARIHNQFDFSKVPFQEISQEIFKKFPDNKFLFKQEMASIWFKSKTDAKTLGDKKSFTFYNGTKTGNNSKYLSTKKESSLHYPVLKGKDFYRYVIYGFENYIEFDKNNLWSNYNDDHFKVAEKLLIRRTSDHLAVAYDNQQFYVLDTVHVLYSVDNNIATGYLFALLNSKLFQLLYNLIVPETGKAFAEVKITNLKKLPIRFAQPRIQNEIKSLAFTMQKLHSEFQAISLNFSSFLLKKFSITKPSRKIQDWSNLEFGEFIKELNKLIKKTNRERSKEGLDLVKELTTKDEFEWMELFKENKKKAVELQQQIHETDRKIDQMVYELYGLTEEEIQIVEAV